MIKRHITRLVLEALTDTPVVLIVGARQTGKSTLVQSLAENKRPARYITLDDAGVLAAASSNPHGFIDGLEGPVVLDEVQRAPGIFLAIKAAVDRKRTPGRFLLTGSANVLLLPRIADSLAGRMEVLTLRPFAQSEIEGRAGSVIDTMFAEKFSLGSLKKESREQLIDRVVTGGFPEAVQRASSHRRSAWFGSYVTTILERDVRELAHINGLTALPRLLSLLAARSGSLLNFSELSNTAAIPQTTLKRYMTLLETTFLIHLLPAWVAHLGKRLIKTPKLFLNDTGLAAHLIGANSVGFADNLTLFGHMLENFVLCELLKHASWSARRTKVYHFRTHAAQEVDFILEDQSGSIVGVEVKSTASVDAYAFRTLRMLADETGKKFVRGIVLYTGREVVPFEKNMFAVPVEVLWK